MQSIKQYLPRFNWKFGLVLLGVLAAVALVPTKPGRSVAAEDCINPPTTPVFNPYPVVFGDPGLACVDFPLVRAKLSTGQYPQNQAELDAGVTAHAGDFVDVLVYFHNGAISNGNPNVTTAFNAHVRTTIDTSATPDHQVRVALQADNANAIHGSTFIHTNANETLEIVDGSGQRFDFQGNLVQSGFTISPDGTFSLGDLHACFEFSGFVKFRVRIVGPPIQQIVCSPHNQTVDLGLPVNFTSNVLGNWSAFGGNPSSSISPSTSFTTSYSTSGQKSVTVTNGTTSDTCNVLVNTPPPQFSCIDVVKETFNAQGQPITPVAQFSFQLDGGAVIVNDSSGHARFSNVFAGTHTVTESIPAGWHQILVTPSGGIVQVFSGAQCATVVFKNQQNFIPGPNPVVCSPKNQTVNVNQTAFFSASGGDGNFSWFASGGNPSTGSGSSSGFNTAYSTTGLHTVTVSSAGSSDTCSVNINQIFNPVICAPHFQTADINQTVFFSATGGNGQFVWSAPGGNPSTGFNSSFSTSYSTSGQKTVTVSSNGTSDTCTVQINQIINQVVCAPHFQSANANQTVFFSATGGTGSFTWSAPNGNPSTGSGSTFNTSYSNSGTHTVTVSSNGQTDTCQVQINQIVNQITCSPHFQNINLGQNVSFFAFGGNGQFFWSAPGATTTSGSGSTFNTSYNNTGTFTVTVSSSGTTDTCQVSVTQIINNQVVCSPHFQSANFGQSVFFSATGGNGQFFWSAPSGSTTVGFSQNFSTTYNSPGQFTVTVSSNGQTDTCQVQVNQIFNNPVICSPHFQNINVNQSVNFFATGGNGQFFWSAPGGNPQSGSSSNFNTSYFNSGTYNVTVSSNGSSDTCVVTVGNRDTGNPNLVFSKRAFNDTKNVDATSTPAARENFITYTLTVTNTGNAASNNFVITDDLSGVLPFADMTDNGGGTMSGNTISFPGVTVPAGGSVSKTFRVRVKFFLSAQQTFIMNNTYGNTVTITIPPIPGTPRFIAPKTGAGSGMAALGFAGVLTSGFAIFRRRGRQLFDLLWN